MTLSPTQIKALAILLEQYQYYQLLHDPGSPEAKGRQLDRECLNQIMLFPDPVIWILYKFLAYQGTKTAINTLGDLRKHCDHGICQKRWLFLNEHVPEIILQDPTTKLETIAKYLLQLPLSEQLFIKWKSCEYNGVSGIKKWNNYLAKIS